MVIEAATWTEYGSADEPRVPEKVAIGDAKLLEPAGGSAWARLKDGRLLRIIGERAPMETANPWKANRIALVRREEVVDQRYGQVGGGHRTAVRERLTEAQLATEADYAAAQRSDQRKAARQAAKERRAPYDALSRFSFLYGVRGAPGVVSAFRGEHIELVAVADDLVSVPLLPGGAVTFAHAEATAAVKPLVLPYKQTGQEPTCDCPHKGQPPVAVGVIGSGVLACGPHLSGELGLEAMTTTQQLIRQIAAVAAEVSDNALRPVRQRIARLEHVQQVRERRTVPRGLEAEYERRRQVEDRLAQARERDGD